MSFKGIIKGLVGLGVVAAILLSSKIVETVESGHYQIKQGAVSGDMTIHADEGPYPQMFGTIHDYRVTGAFNQSVDITFKDGSTAKVPVSIDYRLPVKPMERLKLHRDMLSYSSVVTAQVPSIIVDMLKLTGNSFGAEEIYSKSRGEFKKMFERQLSEGQFKMQQGSSVNAPSVVVLDDKGQPVILTTSVLTDYGFRIIKVTLGKFDFDDQTDRLIKLRKTAEQEETLARSEAERSKQDAITAVEKGKANVATAKYESLVTKERAVIEAEKKTAMAREATKQAKERAEQIKAKGEADAYAAKLKVEAGLSPLEQAVIDKDTSIGIAQALGGKDGITFPSVMVFGSGAGGNSPMNPFDAVGLKAFQDMARESATAGK